MSRYIIKSDVSEFSIAILASFELYGYVLYKTRSMDLTAFAFHGGVSIRDTCTVRLLNPQLYDLLIKNIDKVSIVKDSWCGKELLLIKGECFDECILPHIHHTIIHV